MNERLYLTDNTMKTIIFVTFMLLTTSIMAGKDFDRQQIQKRISPVGKVRLTTDAATKVPEDVAEPVKEVVLAPGQKTYQQFCQVCHANGLAKAPKFQNAADWKARTNAKNLDALTASAIKGMNAMPAKGTCATCSDEDIKQAVQYMLPKS